MKLSLSFLVWSKDVELVVGVNFFIGSFKTFISILYIREIRSCQPEKERRLRPGGFL